MIRTYLFSIDTADPADSQQLLGTYMRHGQERVTWIQNDPDNLLTRQWFEPGSEPPFDRDRYPNLQELR